jgi:uncharacterized iron-regulated membrane protein
MSFLTDPVALGTLLVQGGIVILIFAALFFYMVPVIYSKDGHPSKQEWHNLIGFAAVGVIAILIGGLIWSGFFKALGA